MTADVAADGERTSKDAMASISGQLVVLSTGEHALLRRMYLTEKPAADGAVVKLLLHAGIAAHVYERDYSAWRLLAHVSALLSGTGRARVHDGRRGLGAALHDAGLSESRLLRLTAARGPALVDQIVRAARMLAQADEAPINLWTLLHLAGREPQKAEAARIRVAQDYYSAAARA
jgi:CRISPR type I-E-associated protein CasB/Cse2